MSNDEAEAKARRLSQLSSVDVKDGEITVRVSKNSKGGKPPDTE